jgi:hypothetical protein
MYSFIRKIVLTSDILDGVFPTALVIFCMLFMKRELALFLRIRQVSGSNPAPEVDCPEKFLSYFSLSHKANVVIKVKVKVVPMLN